MTSVKIICVTAILLAAVWVILGGIAHAMDTRVADVIAEYTR